MRWSPDSEVLLILRLHQNTEQDLFACQSLRFNLSYA
jgi:hypothetical protein